MYKKLNHLAFQCIHPQNISITDIYIYQKKNFSSHFYSQVLRLTKQIKKIFVETTRAEIFRMGYP